MPESNAFLRPEILARINSLGLRALRVAEGTISGLHRSPLHGLSPEFADYREYTFGDDLKNLDWRAYARSDRFYIKRFEDESNLTATVVLDASASMRYGRGAMTKFIYAATLAASLSALLLKQRDSVGLLTCDTAGQREVRPKSTQTQLVKIIDALEETKPNGQTEIGTVLSSVADQLKRRGMIILISDLLTPQETLNRALGKLQFKGHEVLIFHILDPDELELPFKDSVIFRDIEGDEEVFAEPWAFRKAYAQAMQVFLSEVQGRCRYCGIDYLQLTTDQNLGEALSHFLHRRLRRARVKHNGRMSGAR